MNPQKANIIKVYNEIEKKQIFGTKEIEVILGCSSSTARAVMAKLRDMNDCYSSKRQRKGKIYIYRINIVLYLYF